MGNLTSDQVTGIVLIVLGALALFGNLAGFLFTVAAIALLVYGILILIGTVRGAQWLGVVCVVAGVLLLAGWVPYLKAILAILVAVVGIVLIVLGILKLAGK